MQISVGQNVREQLEGDLKLEIGAVVSIQRAIKLSAEAGDNASRELFERLLEDEEGHASRCGINSYIRR